VFAGVEGKSGLGTSLDSACEGAGREGTFRCRGDVTEITGPDVVPDATGVREFFSGLGTDAFGGVRPQHSAMVSLDVSATHTAMMMYATLTRMSTHVTSWPETASDLTSSCPVEAPMKSPPRRVMNAQTSPESSSAFSSCPSYGWTSAWTTPRMKSSSSAA